MTPPTKEAYYYRMIYEQHFPSMAAVCTVPQNKSIACSTEKAIEWDELFKKNADESGRAVLGVHATSGTDKAMDLSKRTAENEMNAQTEAKSEVKVTIDTRLSPIKKFK
jgi:asparagine synthase (glutamine-hydrolysing)